jgi:hypothetical protein
VRYSGSLGRRIGREISVAPIVNELHESVEVLSEDPNFGTILCQSELFLTKMHRSVGYDRPIGFRKPELDYRAGLLQDQMKIPPSARRGMDCRVCLASQ